MKYTTIEIPYSQDSRKANGWLRKTIGKSKGEDGKLKWNEMIWFSRVIFTRAGDPRAVRFHFRNPEHATIFALRWS